MLLIARYASREVIVVKANKMNPAVVKAITFEHSRIVF